ncbi:P-loop containing nucleoside triphosphate hydrolase protein [Mycena rebaudengoi]|nr:P-loop containing nucleoside triphosphate hydrolase protein [Mycena rebaudengoi]
MDPLHTPIELPISLAAFNAFQALPRQFMESLSPRDRCTVLDAFLLLDIASKGTKTPRELQLRSVLALSHGNDLLVRAGTGSGKTLAMILPALALKSNAVIITISPLRIIQDNHVVEFTKYGLPSIAINQHTSNDRDLWKTIRNHEHYRHYSVSPEQCGSYQGHITRFARLLHDPKWTKKIGLLQIDEAHFIATTGIAEKKNKGPFRPAYSDLGERVRVHLPTATSCAAYSATMPPDVINTVTRTLRMEPQKLVTLKLTTNRPNLMHAVIPLIGTTDNFHNLDFLAKFIPRKCIVFINNKKIVTRLAKYLNSLLDPEVAATEPFCHYHSSMSKSYLETTANTFKAANSPIRGLISTGAASNGFDVSDIELVVMFGLAKDKSDYEQMAGRGGRDERECLVLMLAEAWALTDLSLTQPDRTLDVKEARTKPDIIVFTRVNICRRRDLAEHNDDRTDTAVTFTTAWCCDNCPEDGFDLALYLGAPVLTSDWEPELPPVAKTPRRRYRKVACRPALVDSLTDWRSRFHSFDPICRDFPIEYILEDTSIALLARESPGSLQVPSDVTSFLGETQEWHNSYALEILTVLLQYDMDDPDDSSSEGSGSDRETESDSDSQCDSGSEEPPSPTRGDLDEASAPPPISPSSSTSSSPQSSRPVTPEPAQSTSGRPLRQAAINHSIAGIADQLTKKARTHK